MDQALHNFLQQSRLAPWLATLPEQLAQAAREHPHGKQAEWQAVLDALPAITPSRCDFNAAAVRVGLQCYFGYPITPQSEVMEPEAKFA